MLKGTQLTLGNISSSEILITNLLPITKIAINELSLILDKAKAHCFSKLEERHVSTRNFTESNQTVSHTLTWLYTYTTALSQVQNWSEKLSNEGRLGDIEYLIHQIAFSEYLAQIRGGIPISQGEIVRLSNLGIDIDEEDLFKNVDVKNLINNGSSENSMCLLMNLLIESSEQGSTGDVGLNTELNIIREQFRRFTTEQIEPYAQRWHLENELLPKSLIEDMADLGVFGLTIPEEYGGSGESKVAMCVLSEELSRGYLGVGSLSTRSDIAAELILSGGTDLQKSYWLPKIACGEVLPTAVFTEPDIGSDLGSIKTKATRTDKHYKISGNKTWITHGSRADLMTVLARTDLTSDDHSGLSMFLAPKIAGNNYELFPSPGLNGSEIPVIGYKGMKEYEVVFTDFEVKVENLLGATEGSGFKQLMHTFESARIQTASRAIGVAQSAYELALRYAQERSQFGKTIINFPRIKNKLAMMVVELMIARQTTYHAARQKDKQKRCDLEAGVAKLLSARIAWAASDNSLQIHGSYGYAAEHPSSRLLCDARIISIFEGTAEIQASIIARRLLSD